VIAVRVAFVRVVVVGGVHDACLRPRSRVDDDDDDLCGGDAIVARVRVACGA
jgi:hypothetical protein